MYKKSKVKPLFGAALLAGSAVLSTPVGAATDAMMDLLKILRDKGSLTNDEYQMLVNAAKADDEKTEAVKTEVTKTVDDKLAAAAKTTESMSWASKVKVKGDMRVRYQYQDKDGTINRDRGRVRARAGIIATPTDGWEVGLGLASGSSDLRSTNQSFDETFSTKAINMDYGYVQYAFSSQLKGIAGKFQFKNYLYTPTDLMWDGDINPEGASLNFGFANGVGKGWVNGGLWVLEENSGSKKDPWMGYVQLGQGFGSGDISGKIAATYYGFEELTSLGSIATDGTNTDYRFSIINLAAELGTNLANGKASIFGEYVNNLDTKTSQDNGFSIGAKFATGDWEFKYIYADLDANAVPDILPDSDRYDGLTDMKGHEFIVEYGIMKNVTLGLDYYRTRRKSTHIDQDILQADVVVKF